MALFKLFLPENGVTDGGRRSRSSTASEDPGKGNVFTGVCLSVQGGVTITHDVDLTVTLYTDL